MSCAIAKLSRVSPSRNSPGERLARREADRVHDDVEAVPVLAELGEQVLDLRVAGDVARQHDVRAERVRGFVDAILELVVDVRERKLGAFAMHRVGDAPGDRAVIEHAGDQRALAVQEAHESSGNDVDETASLTRAATQSAARRRRAGDRRACRRLRSSVGFMPLQLARATRRSACAMLDSVSPDLTT